MCGWSKGGEGTPHQFPCSSYDSFWTLLHITQNSKEGFKYEGLCLLDSGYKISYSGTIPSNTPQDGLCSLIPSSLQIPKLPCFSWNISINISMFSKDTPLIRFIMPWEGLFMSCSRTVLSGYVKGQTRWRKGSREMSHLTEGYIMFIKGVCTKRKIKLWLHVNREHLM